MGLNLLNKLKDELQDIAQVDQEPSLEGRQLLMVLSPLMAHPRAGLRTARALSTSHVKPRHSLACLRPTSLSSPTMTAL